MTHFGINERAWLPADRCAERADELRVAVHTMSRGAPVLFHAGRVAPDILRASLAS